MDKILYSSKVAKENKTQPKYNLNDNDFDNKTFLKIVIPKIIILFIILVLYFVFIH